MQITLQFYLNWSLFVCLFCPAGNFGGGVESYFLFLRFLVVLNFVSFLLMAGFVIIPSFVFRSAGTSFVNSTGEESFCFALTHPLQSRVFLLHITSLPVFSSLIHLNKTRRIFLELDVRVFKQKSPKMADLNVGSRTRRGIFAQK